MNLDLLFADKTKKAKTKVEIISQWWLEGFLSSDELLKYAKKTNDKNKATCIEAMEFATRLNPSIANAAVFTFVTKMLADNAPRVKWESAKVVGNIAKNFPSKLSKPISLLLTNASNNGIVVRWAASYALGEILKLNSKQNNYLLPAIKAICESEEDNAIKKKYLSAIKKLKF